MRRTPNVKFYVCEIAFGRRPFEVTGDDPLDVQFRTDHVLWLKENAINETVKRFPQEWQYFAYFDGDMTTTRHDWALEAIHQLQHYPAVQLYSSYSHLSLDHRPIRVTPSFAYVYRNYPPPAFSALEAATTGRGSAARRDHVPPNAVGSGYEVPPNALDVISTGAKAPALARRTLNLPGATGGAWAYRREAFTALGGLLDVCITGSSDWHMAFGMVGEIRTDNPETEAFELLAGELKCSNAYGQAIRGWQERAFDVVKGNVGYVDQHLSHHWHGPYSSRSYGTRWRILKTHDFQPHVDLVRDWQGLWSWRGNKPQMEQAIAKYFTSRNEDSTDMGTEVPML